MIWEKKVDEFTSRRNHITRVCAVGSFLVGAIAFGGQLAWDELVDHHEPSLAAVLVDAAVAVTGIKMSPEIANYSTPRSSQVTPTQLH